MPIPQTQATLKSYFQNGDEPTEAQFAEFIDTMFYLYNAATDAAEAATTASEAAQAAAEAVSPTVLLSSTNGGVILGTDVGVSTIASLGGFNFRINFTSAFANTNYKILLQGCTLVAKTTAHLDVTAVSATFYVALWT